MRSDRRRWYSVRCSGVPFLKCAIWPFPLTTSVLLPIFIRGQALRIQIGTRALCPSHFKNTLCIAPLSSVDIFMWEVPCPQNKRADLFKNVCLHMCVWAHSQNHFLLAFVYNSLFFKYPTVLFTQMERPAFCASAPCFYHTYERH